MKLTHEYIDSVIRDAEELQQQGRDIFNNKSQPYYERQKGLSLIDRGSKMLALAGKLRFQLNNKLNLFDDDEIQ